MDNQPFTPPAPELGINLDLNTNSQVAGSSDAQIVYYALQDYKMNLLAGILRDYDEAVKTKNEEVLFEVATDWRIFKKTDLLQIEIVDSLFSLAESNYWATSNAVSPNDYIEIRKGHNKMKGELVSEFLKDIKQ